MWKVVILLVSLVLTGCVGGEGNLAATPTPAPTATIFETPAPDNMTGETPMIEIVMQDGSIMTAELYPAVAPISVANFLKLIDDNFFDGLIFHRVIPGFMIQGGGFTPEGVQKQAASIKGEFASNGIKNDLKHTRGVLSMARTNVKDSASSQFFVMVDDAPHLDGEYAAFGKVISGMEIADKIVSQKTDAMDKPLTNQIIQTIRRK